MRFVITPTKGHGHSTTIPLDQSYLKPTMERLFQEYKKGIEGLTINKRASL